MTIFQFVFSLTVLFFLRTVLISGLFYYFLYARKNSFQKFNTKFPSKIIIKKELILTLKSFFAFLLFDTLAFCLYKEGYTLIYTDFSKYSFGYYLASVLLLFIFHDFYFYWTHRWMHTKSGRWINHKIHHQFHNPTPFSTLSVSFNESIVQIFFHLLIVFILPLHVSVLIFYFVFNYITNSIGHSGFEIFKESSFFTGSYSHYRHHNEPKKNFALYFKFWDVLFKTSAKGSK